MRTLNASATVAAASMTIAIAVGVVTPAAAQNIQVIVLKGDPVPDGNGTFSAFTPPALNDEGQVAFAASLTGVTPGSGTSGVYRAAAATDSLVRIVRDGDPAPDANGVFQSLYGNFAGTGKRLLLNNAGQVVFHCLLAETANGSSDHEVIIRGAGGAGTLVQIARRGQIVATPNGEGTLTSLWVKFAMNDTGQVALRPSHSTSGSTIFRGDGVSLEHMASNSLNFPFSCCDPPALNESGTVVFGVIGAIGISNGTPSIYLKTWGSQHVINDMGQVAYGLAGSPNGLWRDNTPIAQGGDPVPGGNGTMNVNDTYGFGLNNLGHVVFHVTNHADGGDRMILRGDGINPHVQVVRSGEPLPNGGGVVGTVGVHNAINDTGEVACIQDVLIDNGQGGFTTGKSIFFYDDNSGLIEIIRTGEPFLGGTINSLGFQGVYSGGGAAGNQGSAELDGFNNLGQVAFSFTLNNGASGIAIWSPNGTPTLPGDITGDGVVDINDLLAVIGGWGPCPAPPAECAADISPPPDGDGQVNIDDLLMVISNWG